MKLTRYLPAILVGAQVVVSGSVLTDLIGAKWAALASLLVAAGWAVEARLVTPQAPTVPPPPAPPPGAGGLKG